MLVMHISSIKSVTSWLRLQSDSSLACILFLVLFLYYYVGIWNIYLIVCNNPKARLPHIHATKYGHVPCDCIIILDFVCCWEFVVFGTVGMFIDMDIFKFHGKYHLQWINLIYLEYLLMMALHIDSDEELLGQGLELNDNIQNLLAKLDALASGSPLPAVVSESTPSPKGSIIPKPSATNRYDDEEDDDDDDDFAQLARRYH